MIGPRDQLFFGGPTLTPKSNERTEGILYFVPIVELELIRLSGARLFSVADGRPCDDK
jgi:hypothetical protein